MTPSKQELVPVGSASGLKELLESRSEAIKTLASKYVTPDRLIKTALVAASRTPALYKCTKVSILQACMDAASLGVDLSPAKKHAAIVPFGSDATLIPMYQGYIDIAWRSNKIRISAAVVYQAEVSRGCFSYTLGTNPGINHAPLTGIEDDNGEELELGPVVHFYAVATYPDGFKQFVVMSKREVDRVRNASRASTGPAWTNWYEEMGKKTAIRRLFKTLSMSDDMADLVDVDDTNAGLDESMLVGGAEITPVDESEDRAADLAGRLTVEKSQGEIVNFPGNGAPEDDSKAETQKGAPEPAKKEKVPEAPSGAPVEPKKRGRGRPAGAKNKPKADPKPKAEPPTDDADRSPGTSEAENQQIQKDIDRISSEATDVWNPDSLIDSIRQLNTREDFAEWVKEHTDHISELSAEDKVRVQTPFIARQKELGLIPNDDPTDQT